MRTRAPKACCWPQAQPGGCPSLTLRDPGAPSLAPQIRDSHGRALPHGEQPAGNGGPQARAPGPAPGKAAQQAAAGPGQAGGSASARLEEGGVARPGRARAPTHTPTPTPAVPTRRLRNPPSCRGASPRRSEAPTSPEAAEGGAGAAAAREPQAPAPPRFPPAPSKKPRIWRRRSPSLANPLFGNGLPPIGSLSFRSAPPLSLLALCGSCFPGAELRDVSARASTCWGGGGETR
ncbi:uncharacterized protein LOC141502547 [Macrotis lagotis]|uniref:uncharacterized protein LOC141502547 n=1 Tax=Macrotis lagotis TaxID=92651 RepID=UPI003D698D63